MKQPAAAPSAHSQTARGKPHVKFLSDPESISVWTEPLVRCFPPTLGSLFPDNHVDGSHTSARLTSRDKKTVASSPPLFVLCATWDTARAHRSHFFFAPQSSGLSSKSILYFLFFFSLFFGWYCSIFFFVPRMLIPTWNRCCALMFLVAALRTGTSQVLEAARPKANSIKPALLEETPTPPTNRSATVHTGVTKKHSILAQVITKKKKTL